MDALDRQQTYERAKELSDTYYTRRAEEEFGDYIAKEPDNLEKSEEVLKDVENQQIIEKPRFATNGVVTFEEPLPFTDKEGLLNILEKYNVQEWKEDYTTEDPDSYQGGYGWMILLQFEDGTNERYKGAGTEEETIFPGNFDEFSEEMKVFKMDKIEEGKE